jgi:hypothetical protein
MNTRFVLTVILTLGIAIAIALATSMILIEQQQKDAFKAEDGRRSMTF